MDHSGGFSKLFNSLIGIWSLSRNVSSGESMQGSLEFSNLDDKRLVARETGELVMTSGNLITATRQWIWSFDGTRLSVFFDEEPPRLYHQMIPTERLGSWRCEGQHDCAPDTYIGEYLFLSNKFTVKQEVIGPKKDYQINSEYTRLSPTQTS